MTHVGTRGGPRGDDNLEPLPPDLAGLTGVELVRAALAKSRPEQIQIERRRPFAVSQAPAPVQPDWTPHSALQGSPPIPTPGHWSDGVPIPDEAPPEEDL